MKKSFEPLTSFKEFGGFGGWSNAGFRSLVFRGLGSSFRAWVGALGLTTMGYYTLRVP